MQISLRGIEISLPTDATHIYVAERLSFISSNKLFIRHIYFPSYSFYIPLFDLKKQVELYHNFFLHKSQLKTLNDTRSATYICSHGFSKASTLRA